jgi:hypothetical protein
VRRRRRLTSTSTVPHFSVTALNSASISSGCEEAGAAGSVSSAVADAAAQALGRCQPTTLAALMRLPTPPPLRSHLAHVGAHDDGLAAQLGDLVGHLLGCRGGRAAVKRRR